MHEEAEGNGRLMAHKAGSYPLIWTQSAGSVRRPEEAFEVSIVLEAPATNHLHDARTHYQARARLKCVHTSGENNKRRRRRGDERE